MKSRIYQIIYAVAMLVWTQSARSQEIDTTHFELFNYEAEGKTYVMQQ